MPEEEIEEEYDYLEVFRVGLLLLAMALQAYLIWDYVKDRPETEIARRRVRSWWDDIFHEPKRLRKMQHETVFEAITIVDGEH